jgi:predicted nucleotide-binding protein
MAEVAEIIKEIDKLQGELKEILSSPKDPHFINEQIDRWTNRAHSLLVSWGFPEDANKLSGVHHSTRYNDFGGNIRRKANAREVVLQVFREDMERHPEFYTQRSPQLGPEASVQTVTPPSPRKVFLGHGRHPLWARVHTFLKDELGLDVEVWESESRSGHHVVDVLKEMLGKCGFAVLVVIGEDSTSDGSARARQNVIHEIGLFQGRLGFEKVALLIQEGVEGFSNIDGLQRIYFRDEKIETGFYELERMLKREGITK